MKTNRNYLLGLLTVLLAFNYMDRFALGIALQDIKTSLHLSDSQLGFLSGMAFALFYSTLGVPIARMADRGNRVTIISLSAGIWSVAVTLCGAAVTFLQLMLIRVIVGVGEAGCVPPSLSLIADYFTRKERPRAASFYMQGVSISLLVGYFAAGWLNEIFGWRVMFAVIGLPGVALAVLTRTTLVEPRIAREDEKNGAAADQTFLSVCATVWRIRTFRHLLYALAVNWLFSYGIVQWTPTFFLRSFGLRTGELGTSLALIYGATALLGTYLGGEWVTRFASRNEGRQLRAMALITGISAVLMAVAYIPTLAPSYFLSLAWFGLSMLTGAMANGPPFAVIQTLVPERMRAIAISLVYLFGNLIGIGLGPWAVGVISDAMRPWAGDASLRFALLALCPVCVWSAWHFWAAGRTVGDEVALAHEGGGTDGDKRLVALSST